VQQSLIDYFVLRGFYACRFSKDSEWIVVGTDHFEIAGIIGYKRAAYIVPLDVGCWEVGIEFGRDDICSETQVKELVKRVIDSKKI
jgi:hypothetical protein